MRHFIQIFSFITAMLFVACKNDTGVQADATSLAAADAHQQDTAHFTTAVWLDSSQNFGTVPKGKQVPIVFHVKNTGESPMFISAARPSCGCTVADFTKSAIAPGSTGKVTASFDSNHGMPGRIHKTITVVSNTNPTSKTLVFEGMVEEAKK